MGGSLEYEEILSATKGRKHANIKNFLETGTYFGQSALMAAKHFDNVYTVEIYEPLYNECVERAKKEGVDNIHFFLGDSLDRLPEMVEHVKDGVVCFIDAHISGNDSSWNGKERVPLLQELDIILSYKLGPSLFIVDDIRFFKHHEKEAWDWNHIDNIKIVKMFKEKGYKVISFFESNDRLWILTE